MQTEMEWMSEGRKEGDNAVRGGRREGWMDGCKRTKVGRVKEQKKKRRDLSEREPTEKREGIHSRFDVP